MTDESEADPAGGDAAATLGVGAQLRAAREKRGLTLEQVAAQTRISARQLAKIEEGAFHDLPSRIYAIAFSKTYAKTVGLDHDDVADLVRAELGQEHEVRASASDFAPGDPARGPSGRLVWFSVFAIALLIVGLFFAAKVMMSPAAPARTLIEQQAEEDAAAQAAQDAVAGAAAGGAAAQPADPRGAVTLTAEGAVWLRITDGSGARLMEGELGAGQSYTIPATAAGPKLITARPDLLAISIGGRKVAKISETLRTLSDEPIDAASLLARPRPTAATTAASGAPGAPATTAATVD